MINMLSKDTNIKFLQDQTEKVYMQMLNLDMEFTFNYNDRSVCKSGIGDIYIVLNDTVYATSKRQTTS